LFVYVKTRKRPHIDGLVLLRYHLATPRKYNGYVNDVLSDVILKDVTPWRKTDRSHGGKNSYHGHFVYKPLKHVQNFGTKKGLAPLARSFRAGLRVRADLNSYQFFWIQTAQQISLQIFRHGTDRYSAMV
jgi:hypothetical protein